MSDDHAAAMAVAQNFLSLPESVKRKLVDLVIADPESMQNAVNAGQWSLYTFQLSLRAAFGLPPIVVTP